MLCCATHLNFITWNSFFLHVTVNLLKNNKFRHSFIPTAFFIALQKCVIHLVIDTTTLLQLTWSVLLPMFFRLWCHCVGDLALMYWKCTVIVHYFDNVYHWVYIDLLICASYSIFCSWFFFVSNCYHLITSKWPKCIQ